MKRFLLVAFAALLISSTLSAATDVSGKWSGFPVYLTLKQEGNSVSGSAGETEDDQVPFGGGIIEDDRLTLKLGGTEINLLVQGDQMSGDIHKDERTMKIVFRRLKPRDSSAPPPVFDAASVKRSPPQPMGKGISSSMKADPGRLTCTNVSLKRLIVSAWGLKEYQLSAPDWMNDERYDLTATMPAGTPPHEVLLMLQGLLVDRFRLATHNESKEYSIFGLVPDKNGLKLKPADGFGGTSISSSPKGRSLRANVTMKTFAGILSGLVDRPVIDMTGLPGGFKIDLEWTPDETLSSPKGTESAGDPIQGTDIFTALREVGLRLEARKGPIEMLVVDRGEKIPVEN